MIKDIVKGDECAERLVYKDSVIAEYAKLESAMEVKDSTCQHSNTILKQQLSRTESKVASLKMAGQIKNVGMIGLFILVILVAL